jgi:HSP20 family protein
MFDREKILRWSEMVREMPGRDFWAGVFNSPAAARFFEQVAEMANFQDPFPRTDVYRTENEIVVLVDLPGVKRQDVQILVADGRLVIKGAVPAPEQSYRLVSGERRTGSFERTISLPEAVGRGGYRAVLRDGLLEIRLPRGYEAAFRTIPLDGEE